MQLSNKQRKKDCDSRNIILRQLDFAKFCANDFLKSLKMSESCHLVAVLRIFLQFKFLDGCALWKKCTKNLWIAALINVVLSEMVVTLFLLVLAYVFICFFFWVEDLVVLFVDLTTGHISRFLLYVLWTEHHYNKDILEQELWDLLQDRPGSGEGNERRTASTLISSAM